MKALWTAVCVIGLAGASAALATATLSTNVVAEDAAVVEGVIESVAQDKSGFGLRTSDNSVSVRVNDETAYTLNGEASTFDEAVEAGRDARVTHTDGMASKVEVTSEA